ncbi:HlyD family secretion protein [Massilia putida]|uniref:HlyD family secretion protein n=1 Tax=Massilia putida TaxID=1141883 RepID=UPI001E59BE34|nr:HlyD family efflux transporter periplasmic adaptor subunit [Massilia putida]
MDKLTSQKKQIFRQQAIDFVGSRQYRTVILANYVSHRILTTIFGVIVILIIIFFTSFSTARRVEVSGILLPSNGLIRIKSGQTGIVAQVRVKEGQKVKAGEVLFVLLNERNIGSSKSAESTVSTLLRNRSDSYQEELLQIDQQSSQRALAAQKRAAALQEEAKRLELQIALQKSRIELVTLAFKRFKDLHATNYISSGQMEEKEGELLDQRQRLAELERLKAVSERDYVSAQADYLDLKYQAKRDEEALKRNALAIQQDLAESEARREIRVIAPTAGTVTTITVEIGKQVMADSALASLLPADSKLEAEVYVPSRSIGFVKPGMKVMLRYQAYPYQKFGQYEASIQEVTSTSISAHELTLPGGAMIANQTGEPLYRMRLRLKQQEVLVYGKPTGLKSGMLLDASIILEHRHLYEWILEPLFSICGRN